MYLLFVETIVLFLLPILLILPENKGFVNNLSPVLTGDLSGDYFKSLKKRQND